MPLKALKQSEKAENNISCVVLKLSRWVPLTCAAEETIYYNLPRDKVEVSLRRSLTLFLLPVHSEQFGQILADLYGEKWEAFSGIMCEAEGRSYRKWFKMCNVD